MMIGRGGRIASASSSIVSQGTICSASAPALLDECVGSRGGAVEHRDAVALFGDVERQVGAHDAKADQADIRLRHLSPPMVPAALPVCLSDAND